MLVFEPVWISRSVNSVFSMLVKKKPSKVSTRLTATDDYLSSIALDKSLQCMLKVSVSKFRRSRLQSLVCSVKVKSRDSTTRKWHLLW